MGVTAEQIQITENEFFTSTPEALAFKTDENLDRLYAYIVGVGVKLPQRTLRAGRSHSKRSAAS